MNHKSPSSQANLFIVPVFIKLRPRDRTYRHVALPKMHVLVTNSFLHSAEFLVQINRLFDKIAILYKKCCTDLLATNLVQSQCILEHKDGSSIRYVIGNFSLFAYSSKALFDFEIRESFRQVFQIFQTVSHASQTYSDVI